MHDYYATLQVDPRADPEIIEVAYRRLARKWHPDTSTSPHAAARMRQLNEAYEVLRDPERRSAYDATRAATPPRARRPRTTPPPATRGRSQPLGVLLVILVGFLGALVGIRLLGALARVPLVLALFGAAAYWWVQSLRRSGRR